MSSKNITVIVVVVLVILAGVWLLTKSNNVTPTTNQQQATTQVTQAPVQSTNPGNSANAVTENADGFSPATITIKAGDTVTWTNTDTNPHTVNSNPHPTHTDYPPLNGVGQIAPGQSKSFTFSQPGTYHYHDHLDPVHQGTV